MENDQAPQPVKPRAKRRGCLLGCLITLLAVLILGGVAWWYVRGHLGELVSGIVREEADKSLNGRLEFAKLEIDLAGRAVLRDAEVYLDGEVEPVLECPSVVARFDPFNFIGPNRGRRAVEITLNQPRAVVVREPDGAFNLAKLAKQRDEPSENPMGISVQVRDGQIVFSDWCMLSQGYPEIPAADGLAGELLSELGYIPGGPAEQAVFEETFALDGSVAINQERQELSFNLEAARPAPGGVITAKGSADMDGSAFDARLGLRGTELASFVPYATALFPRLALRLSGGIEPDGKPAPKLPAPSAAGQIREATVHAVQKPGAALSLEVDATLADVYAASAHLPELSLPRFVAHYDPSPQRVSGEFTLLAMGAELDATGKYNIDDDILDATAKLDNAELSKLLAEYGVKDVAASGKLNLDAQLDGSLKQPVVTAKLSSTALKLDKVNLGKLKGTAKLKENVLTLDGVALSGGDLPLRASGSLNLSSQSGELAATAGPLTVADGLSLAGKLSKGGNVPKLEATGKFTASATVKLVNGKPQSKLSLNSDAISFKDYKLTGLTASGSIAAPSIKLDAAEGVLTLPQTVDIAGMQSDGPLKVSLRAGGSVSLQQGGKPAVLALTGSGATQNLAPNKANLSFKIAGPATGPEIKAQLKTTHSEHPLVLSASTTYKQDSNSPLSAKLTWYSTEVDFAGAVNPAKQTVSGKLTAADVDLARFAGAQGVSGTLSVTADVGGTFNAPTLAGKATAPRLAYGKNGRVYEAANISAGFKLTEGNTIAINDGGFDFAGSRFKAGGTLGAETGNLELRSDPFNLFSAVAAVTKTAAAPGAKTAPSRPPLQIDSKGVLVVKLTGKLADPQASIDYASPSGSVEGQHYTDARLLGTANKSQASVSNFSIKSASGGITASAVVKYDPLAYQAGATINNFNLGVLTPVIGVELLNELTGLLNGTVQVDGEGQRFTADGSLTLAQGKFSGVALDSAAAQFHTSGDALEVTSLTVQAQGTQLTASGTIDPDMSQTRFTASAPRLELALLNPLLPDTVPKLGGTLKLDASLAPGKGEYPDVQVDLSNVSQTVTAGAASFSKVAVKATMQDNHLGITQGELALAGGTLNLTGGIDLGRGRNTKTKPSYPLDFAARTQNFDLGEMLAALPPKLTAGVPPGLDGTLTCDVRLTGQSADPQLEGDVGFDLDLAQVEQAKGFGLTGVAGQIAFVENEFRNLDIQLRAAEGSGLSSARITGSGELALNPLRLTPGSAVDIVLAPAGAYTTLSTAYAGVGSFDGSLGGTVHVRGTSQTDLKAEVSGNVVFNASGEKSTVFLKMPESSGQQEQKPAPFSFGKTGLLLSFKPGTVVEGPYDLRARLNGDITLRGRPGVKEGADKFEIAGTLDLPEGSLFVYRHTIRLDSSTRNYLSFTGGDVFPYFTGRGAVVLPNVLAQADLGTAQTITGMQQTQMGSERDLTVYFAFNNVRLGGGSEQMMNEVALSSQPPLPVDKIQTYLLGGAGELLAGRGDFGEIAQGELVGLGTSFISREIERMFDLQAFRLGTGEGGSYYTYVEKGLTDDVSLSYYKDFFSQTGQKEQWGVKYQLYNAVSGSRYQNLTLNVNFTERGTGASGSEFMFQWNTRF